MFFKTEANSKEGDSSKDAMETLQILRRLKIAQCKQYSILCIKYSKIIVRPKFDLGSYRISCRIGYIGILVTQPRGS